MKTEKLFYNNPDQRDFEARVVAVAAEGIVLDRTLFYPQGGYQESDSGVLRWRGETVDIVQVTDDAGVVYHKTNTTPSFQPGDSVEGSIDWDKRRYLSVLHSAQHILSRIIFNKYKLHTVRSEFCVNGGMVMVSDNFRNEWLGETEVRLREIIEKGFPFERVFSGDHISIRIGDFDTTPCGGTHVANSSELSDVFLWGTEKGKLLFDGGTRGFDRLADSGRKLMAIRKMYNFPDDIVETVEQTIDNYNAMSASLEKFRQELFLNALKDEGLVRTIKDMKVSLILHDELDSKIIKKTFKMKDVRYCADLYIIGMGSKMVVYAATDKLNAADLCSALLTSNPGLQGGGNRKRFDISLEGVDAHFVAGHIMARI